MERRIAVMAIIVDNGDSVEDLNAALHEYRDFIVGRMGIPYREVGVQVISVVIDAPQNTISSLAGKIGALEGVSVKTAFSRTVIR